MKHCPVCGIAHGTAPVAPQNSACANFHYPSKGTINKSMHMKDLIAYWFSLKTLHHVKEYLSTQLQKGYPAKQFPMGHYEALRIIIDLIERQEHDLYGLSVAKNKYYNS